MIESIANPARTATTAAAVAAAARITRRIRDALERRLALGELRREIASMDDHILRDIGLRREDLTRDFVFPATERRIRVNAAGRESGRRAGAFR